ncbi:MAG: transglycosylase SLT domain-containing protein [Candidatus Binatia bacterium]|nr:transglycosylase SLT domain-containing protein [Candidatus Binatia bacterium]
MTKPVHAIGMLYNALSECRRSLPEGKRWEIAETIEREARRHGYDPLFVQAMVEIESTCKPTAKSHMGALGLIQVKPATAREVAKDAGLPWEGSHSLFDPDFNIRVGLHYLNQLEERFGDPKVAIGAYNLGPTRAARLGKDRAKNTRYVKNILNRYEDLLARQPTSVGDPT